MKLHWNPDATPPACNQLLSELAGEFPLVADGSAGVPPASPTMRAGRPRSFGLAVNWKEGARDVEVRRDEDGFVIRCGELNGLGRGIGTVLAGTLGEGESARESLPFENFGVMLDMSRNAVMRPDHLRRWMRRLCLFGFNRLMLYTEDTYRLPGEPYFGYLRGGYSEEELRAADAWGAALGIEVSGCIQALGHLEQVLKWPAYEAARDTPSVILGDSDASCALIEKMVATMARSLRSRTLHIGFDEAHDLGRGKFLDKHGFQPPFEIYSRHLARVCAICARHGIRPQIWSDMVFRLGSATGDYYDRASIVPPGVIEALPTGVGMVYWDYYGLGDEHYAGWIARHQALGIPVSVASAVWTWMAPWYDRGFTEATVRPCLAACRAAGIRDVTMTLWGDDGAYCDFDSALAGLAFAADTAWERSVGVPPASSEQGGQDARAPVDLAARFEAACGLSYAHAVLPCEMELARPGKGIPLEQNGYLSDGIGPVLWDDPLYGIIRKNRALAEGGNYWREFAARQESVFAKLDALPARDGMIDLGHARNIADLLRRKVALANAMESAYGSGDRDALRGAAEKIPDVIDAIAALQASFRRQWLRRNRPQGLETAQIRFAGLAERYRELGRRLEEHLDGRAASIPEWDEAPDAPARGLVLWRRIASPGIL